MEISSHSACMTTAHSVARHECASWLPNRSHPRAPPSLNTPPLYSRLHSFLVALPAKQQIQRCWSFPSGTAPTPACAAVSLCCDWTRATGGGRSSTGSFRQQGGNSIRKEEGREGGRWYVHAKNTAWPAKPDVMQQQEESRRGGGALWWKEGSRRVR